MPKKDELLDSIAIIDDGIHAMNLRLADMLPVKGFHELQKERDEALDRLDFLIKLFAKKSTLRFVKADDELAVVNQEMKKTLAKIESIAKILEGARRFVAAIDTFIAGITKVVQ